MDRSLLEAWNRLRGMGAIPDSDLRRLLNGSRDRVLQIVLDYARVHRTRIALLIEEGPNATLLARIALDGGSLSEAELVRIIELTSVHWHQKNRAAWYLNHIEATPASLRVSIVNVLNQRDGALSKLLDVGDPDDWDFALTYCYPQERIREKFVRKMIAAGRLPSTGVVIPSDLQELAGKLKSENQEREDLMKKLLGL